MTKDYRSGWHIKRDNAGRRFVLQAQGERQLTFPWDKYGSEAAAEAEALMAAASMVCQSQVCDRLAAVRKRRAKPHNPRAKRIPLSLDDLGKALSIARDEPNGEHMWAMVRYLSVYAQRPVSACLMRVDDWLPEQRCLRVAIKDTRDGGRREHIHPVLPCDAEWIDRLCDGRQGSAKLFLGPRKRPWKVVEWGGKSCTTELQSAWRRVARKAGLNLPGQSGLYALKDRAVESALTGVDGWAQAVPLEKFSKLFIGHRRVQVTAQHYMAAGLREAAAFTMGG